MKFAIAFCVLFLAALTLARPGDDHYTDRYDNINVDEILENKKLLENYFNCLMEKGKCTADGKELKEHIIEALENKCGKCTEAQRKGSEHVIKHLVNKEVELWNQLRAKYDPDDKYASKYEKELAEIKG